MGCHTWIYKKESALTQEEKTFFINKVLDDKKSSLTAYKSFTSYKKTMIPFFKDMVNDYKDITIDDCGSEEEYQKCVEMINDYKACIENEDVLKAKWDNRLKNLNEGIKILSLYTEESLKYAVEDDSNIDGVDYEIIDGIRYISLTGMEHDPFRVSGYPEDVFTSKEDLLNFLKTTTNYIRVYVNGEYLNGYTDELVQAVNDLFARHGDENLLVLFG